jgi:hypothetical protein
MLPSPTTATMRTASSRDVAWPATPPIPGEQATPEKRRVAELEGASKGEVLGRWNRVGWKTRTVPAPVAAEAEVGRVVAMGGRGGSGCTSSSSTARGFGYLFLVTGLSRRPEPLSFVRSSIDGPR